MLTKEDLDQIAEAFGLTYATPVDVFPVYDGFVSLNDKVWWAGEYGPQLILVKDHVQNIRGYPHIHSIAKPLYEEEMKVFYTGEYETEQG